MRCCVRCAGLFSPAWFLDWNPKTTWLHAKIVVYSYFREQKITLLRLLPRLDEWLPRETTSISTVIWHKIKVIAPLGGLHFFFPTSWRGGASACRPIDTNCGKVVDRSNIFPTPTHIYISISAPPCSRETELGTNVGVFQRGVLRWGMLCRVNTLLTNCREWQLPVVVWFGLVMMIRMYTVYSIPGELSSQDRFWRLVLYIPPPQQARGASIAERGGIGMMIWFRSFQKRVV